MPLAVEWTNLHQILRSLYADMLPLCSDMMGIAKGLAGLGALFFIAYRVWKSLAAAEPGSHRVVRVSDADSDVLARLQGIGVRPGAVVRVRTQPPRYVGAAGEALGLTPAEAETIRVRGVLACPSSPARPRRGGRIRREMAGASLRGMDVARDCAAPYFVTCRSCARGLSSSWS